MSDEPSRPGAALVALRWKKAKGPARRHQSEIMAKARLTPPEHGGPWYSVADLVKEFGHTKGFFTAAIRSGRLKVYLRPNGKRAGRHWVSATNATRFVLAHERAAARKKATTQ